MRILIAEDEPSLRENLQWMLELEGYEVVAACDGQDAFAKAKDQPPDLVLTDVMMPLLDGYGLIKALRENAGTGSVPIIMLTAKADRADVRAGMNLGADDYLTKPCRREELLEAVQAAETQLAAAQVVLDAALAELSAAQAMTPPHLPPRSGAMAGQFRDDTLS